MSHPPYNPARGQRPRRVRFQMRSRRDAVPPAVERVVRLAAAVGLTPTQADDLAVAVSEALANAALHGNALREEARVHVTVTVLKGAWARVEVRDSGRGFDHGRLSDPTAPEGLMAPRGRGVFLMRRLVDEVEYNDLGNCVRLTVHHRPTGS